MIDNEFYANRPSRRLPIARRRDPETSHEAARSYAESGQHGKDQLLMLKLIRERPGHTAAEYGEILWERMLRDPKHAGVRPFVLAYRASRMTTKRISDIQDHLRAGAPRRCTVTGKRARPQYPK